MIYAFIYLLYNKIANNYKVNHSKTFLTCLFILKHFLKPMNVEKGKKKKKRKEKKRKKKRKKKK